MIGEDGNNDIIVYTFGCRMNTFESNCIKEILRSLQMKNIIVINSCAITAESERQVRQEVRKLKRENPDFHLLLTGCSGQNSTNTYLKMTEVDFVIANECKLQKKVYEQINDYFLSPNKYDKDEIQNNFLTHNKQNIPKNNFENEQYWPYVSNFEDRSRAFVPIQTGCNHYCSFCIVPFTRGVFRSYEPEHIIQQIKIFIKNGYNEVVLTGIDITDYGKDKRGQWSIDTLGKLCKEILKQTTLLRLRLSSVDVAEIDEDIIDLIENENRFMPYFHISLQSGSNDILKKMRRRHTKEDVFMFCEKILKCRPETTFGADIIAGFPSETEEDFKQSVELVKRIPITFIHAFPYSKRERTLASLMDDDVDKRIKKERVNILIQLGKENLIKMYKNMSNKPQKILIEHNFIGRAENFVPIKVLNGEKYDDKKDNKKLENNLIIGKVINVIPTFKNEELVVENI